MKKLVFFLIIIFSYSYLIADDKIEFLKWKKNFKNLALENGISNNTFDLVMKNVKFLPKVIEYDRYQPEFYEDTKTYISKEQQQKKFKKDLNFIKIILN